MADSDSFINEVTEEVRRDRLYALFRRWAWLAILIVVVAVGGAAFLEYRRSQTETAAQGFGDSVIAALDGDAPGDRIAALEAVDSPGPAADILLALLVAGEAADEEGRSAAAERLRAVAETPDLAVRYRHLALLKAHLLAPSSADEARLVLGAMAEPGAPYAALAEEQLALLEISEGDVDGGLDRLRRLEIAAEATPGLQQRAGQLIVAIESGAALIDTAPEPADIELPETTEDGALFGSDLLPPGSDAGTDADGVTETDPTEPVEADDAEADGTDTGLNAEDETSDDP